MEELIRELIMKNKSISIIETENLKCFGLTISGYKDSGFSVERFSVNANAATSSMGIQLIKERKDINTEYTDSIDKAARMASVASEFSGSDFGVGVCGSISAGKVVYIGIFDKETKLTYKVRLSFDKNDVYMNKARIITTIKAQLITLLNTKKPSKKVTPTKTKTVQKQGR